MTTDEHSQKADGCCCFPLIVIVLLLLILWRVSP